MPNLIHSLNSTIHPGQGLAGKACVSTSAMGAWQLATTDFEVLSSTDM